MRKHHRSTVIAVFDYGWLQRHGTKEVYAELPCNFFPRPLLDSGKLVDIGKIDDLRAKVKLPYVLKVYSDNFKIEDNELQVHPVSEKETFVYGSATKIYGLLPYLVTNKMKFTVEEASLSNIFEQYLGGEEGENEKEDW